MKRDICCFGRSIAVIHRHMAAYVSEELKDQELTYSFALFIWHIGRNPGCSQKDLCQYFVIDKTTTAKNIKKMENKGLIYREKDASDHRFNHLYLTETGKVVFLRVKEVFEGMAGILKGTMTEDQEEDAKDVLDIMEENICLEFQKKHT